MCSTALWALAYSLVRQSVYDIRLGSTQTIIYVQQQTQRVHFQPSIAVHLVHTTFPTTDNSDTFTLYFTILLTAITSQLRQCADALAVVVVGIVFIASCAHSLRFEQYAFACVVF